MPTNLAAPLGLDKDLVYKFFLYFSRFEYALKQAGFATGGKKWAKPAWDRFAISLRGKFDSVTADEFKEAIRYLDSKPPKKQVLECGHLGWADNKDDGSPSKEKWILHLVQAVRNNLFHGGKYPCGSVDHLERDRQLLEACLTVMEQSLEFSPKVKQWFFSDDWIEGEENGLELISAHR